MGAVVVGLLIEEQRGEITDTWKRSVEEELGGESAIGFAVGPLLRELSLALRGDVPSSRPRSADGLQRCTVLVRSGAQPARLAREFKLLHRAIWDALRRAGRIIALDERRAADEWLDEALAASLERLERVRMRIDLLERGPAVVSGTRDGAVQSTPPLPRPAPSSMRPPPLPHVRSGQARPPTYPAPAGHVGE